MDAKKIIIGTIQGVQYIMPHAVRPKLSARLKPAPKPSGLSQASRIAK